MFEGSFLYERKFLERFIFTDYFTDEERLILLEILSDFKGDMITESLIESYTEKEFLFEKIGSISPISGIKPIKNIFNSCSLLFFILKLLKIYVNKLYFLNKNC